MWKSYLESNSNFLIARDSNFPGPSTSAASNPNRLFVPSGEQKNNNNYNNQNNGSNETATLDTDFEFVDNLVSPCTPVLFSTNRGLQLRTRRSWRTFGVGSDSKENYSVQFCDLERWSTNRAHVLSISEDSEQMYSDASSNRTRSVGFGLERGSSNSTTPSNR